MKIILSNFNSCENVRFFTKLYVELYISGLDVFFPIYTQMNNLKIIL